MTGTFTGWITVKSLKDLVLALVFLSAVFSSAVLVVSELTEPAEAFNELSGFWRVPLGIYLLLFPTGFILYSLLFVNRKTDALEIFGLSIALSVSTITLAAVMANVLLSFPLGLLHNLLVINALNVLFYFLFVFREKVSPIISHALGYYESRGKIITHQWRKISDSVFLLALLSFFALAFDSFLLPGQTFDEIFSLIAVPAAIFLAFIPPGHFFTILFLKEKNYSLKSLALAFALSLAAFFFSYLVALISGFLFDFAFSFFTVFSFSFAFTFILYSAFVLKERLIPFFSYLNREGA